LQDTLTSNDINVKVSDASGFIGVLEVNNLTATIKDASTINLTGHADSSIFTASDASCIKDYAFETRYLNIKLSDASSARLSVSEKMDVDVSDASALYYKGPGMINRLKVSDGSTIKKMD
jgi:hypothetical protein